MNFKFWLLGISNTGGVQLSYWGEIVTGPFISHGTESDEKKLFEKANDKYKNKSYDVTFHNLEKIFQRLSPKERNEAEGEETDSEDKKSVMDMISIHFISPLTFGRAGLKANYKENFFDVAYFGNSMVQQILPSLTTMLTTDGVVLAENA